uniref:40S ribosomal protein S30 n=1 Tax=Heterorhabditis bacteriophora TaxID=37862 RepID=A0A1I7XV60_HETBA
MQIFINGVDGVKHALDVTSDTTIAEIKVKSALKRLRSISRKRRRRRRVRFFPNANYIVNFLTMNLFALLGRAARRIQYTRRFINVTTGPGKKRGPNSNAA